MIGAKPGSSGGGLGGEGGKGSSYYSHYNLRRRGGLIEKYAGSAHAEMLLSPQVLKWLVLPPPVPD